MLERLETLLSYRVEKEALANHFIISLRDSGSMIQYQAEMLENNEAPGIVTFHSKLKNSELELWYDISLYEELPKYANENKITGKQFIVFLEGIVNTVLNSSKLFLEETHYVLDKEFVYVGKNMTPCLIYLPVQNAESDLKGDFKSLFDYLSSRVEISTGVGDAIQILLKEINSSSFNFKSFSEKLNEVKKQKLGGSMETAARIPQPFIPESVRPIEPVPAKSAAEKLAEAAAPELPKKEDFQKSDGMDMLVKKAVSKETEKKKAPKPAGGKASKSDRFVRVVLIQILVLLGLVSLFKSDFMKGFDITQIAGVALIFIVIDFLVTRKLLGVESQTDAKKEKVKKEKTTRQSASGNLIKKNDHAAIDIKIVKQQKIQSNGSSDKKVPPYQEDATVMDLNNDESTVVLDTAVGSAYLVNNEGGIDTRVSIASNPFIMGKSHQGVDMICSSKHVSRQHAQIIHEVGQYYLVDMSSTNGTYLNGTKLEPNMKYPISSGDIISLAKEDYTFFV